MTNEDRIQREQEFHDRAFQEDVRSRTWGLYSAVDHLFEAYETRVLDGAGGRRTLEIGAGRGGAAFSLARAGDRVMAIDISPAALQIVKQTAMDMGVAVETHQADAHALDFEAGTLDLVCGSGILHHLDIPRAVAEIRRVLRPGGRAVFLEPLGHNPAINLYRRRTPELRTPDETPLRRSHLRLIRREFGETSATYGGLLTLPVALVPLLRSSRAMDAMRSAEKWALKAGWLGSFAWFALIDARVPV